MGVAVGIAGGSAGLDICDLGRQEKYVVLASGDNEFGHLRRLNV